MAALGLCCCAWAFSGFGERCCCAWAFSGFGERGLLFIAVPAGFSSPWLLLLRSTGSRHVGFSSCGSRALELRLSSCGTRAWLLHGMWDLPRPGLEPVSPALAGGFLTPAPPGKPLSLNLEQIMLVCTVTNLQNLMQVCVPIDTIFKPFLTGLKRKNHLSICGI